MLSAYRRDAPATNSMTIYEFDTHPDERSLTATNQFTCDSRLPESEDSTGISPRFVSSRLPQLLADDAVDFGDERLTLPARNRRPGGDVVAAAVAADGAGGPAHRRREVQALPGEEM